MENSTIKSILAADCGSTTTTVVLIEQGAERYEVGATAQTPSTHASPWEDITLGVQEAIRHIEKIISRPILGPGGWPITPHNRNNQGVDAFVVVASAGSPLELVIAGLMNDVSVASAQRAAATTYTHITDILSLDTHPTGQRTEAKIQALLKNQPEAILLVGGTDEGALAPVIELAQTISMAIHVQQGAEMLHVLYAGNQQARPQLADILGTLTALKSMSNVRPTLDVEDLSAAQTELETLYIEKKMARLPGFEKLNNWSPYPITPAAKSFEKLIAYLGQHHHLNVLGVDIGSRSTVITTQTADQLRSTIRSDAGIGYSLASLLETIPLDQIRRWLPFEMTLEALHNQLLNKSLYPNSLPTDQEDLMIEHAVAREILRLMARQAQPAEVQWNLIVGAGRTLTGAPEAAQTALLLIDGLEPWGVTSLALDKNGVVNMLGAVALVEATAAVQVADQDAFLNLGTVIAPSGHGQPDKPAMKVKIESIDGEPMAKEILYGTIEVLPLPPGQRVTVEIRPARHFDIGLGQPGRGAKAEIEGGVLGIIFDARGRPLRLPAGSEQRQEKLQTWFSALNIDHATTRQNN